MSKGHKRIVLILIGVLLTAGSLIWMTYSTSKNLPIPAITFSTGVIAILGTIKAMMFDLSNRFGSANADRKSRGMRKDVF